MDVRETDSDPVCPHCERVLTYIEKRTHGIIETHVVYLCPHCKRLLSVGNNRWDG